MSLSNKKKDVGALVVDLPQAAALLQRLVTVMACAPAPLCDPQARLGCVIPHRVILSGHILPAF